MIMHIDLPAEEFGVSNSFNVADLTPYPGHDLDASRSTPFQGGEDDEDIPTMAPSLPHEQPVATKKMSKDEIRIGPTTRARAKLLEQQVNSLLVDPCACVSLGTLERKAWHEGARRRTRRQCS